MGQVLLWFLPGPILVYSPLGCQQPSDIGQEPYVNAEVSTALKETKPTLPSPASTQRSGDKHARQPAAILLRTSGYLLLHLLIQVSLVVVVSLPR